MKTKPVNHIFLSLDKPIQDTIKVGELNLYLDGSYRPEWNATVVGEVCGLPKNPKGDNARVVSKLKDGDKVLFDYSVVAERTFESDGDYFTEITKDSPYFQKFTNGKGERLLIAAMPGKITHTWVATFHDKRGNFVDGCQGSEHDINRWKAQFSYGETQKFYFKNLIDTGAGDVWKADYRDVFARVIDNELVTVSDRIILEPIDVEIPKDALTEMGIAIPQSHFSSRLGDRAKVLSAPDDANLKKGDIIGFEPQYLEKYEFNDKQYYLIKTRRALGVWEDTNNGL